MHSGVDGSQVTRLPVRSRAMTLDLAQPIGSQTTSLEAKNYRALVLTKWQTYLIIAPVLAPALVAMNRLRRVLGHGGG